VELPASSESLDHTLAALDDPKRRQVVDWLRTQPMRATGSRG
jgi:hypothetical protein